MKRSQAFPSQFIGKDDVSQPLVAVMKSVTQESIKGDGEEQIKPVLYFEGDVKSLILNNINWQTIEEAYGDESDLWTGKPVEMYLDPAVMFGGKKIGGVRVRIPRQQQRQQGGAPVNGDLKAAKAEAWRAFQAARPGGTAAQLAELSVAYFDGISLDALTAQQLRKFTADGFVKPTSPIGDEAEFGEADIPF